MRGCTLRWVAPCDVREGCLALARVCGPLSVGRSLCREEALAKWKTKRARQGALCPADGLDSPRQAAMGTEA